MGPITHVGPVLDFRGQTQRSGPQKTPIGAHTIKTMWALHELTHAGSALPTLSHIKPTVGQKGHVRWVLVVASGVSGQLQNLSRQVLEHSG